MQATPAPTGGFMDGVPLFSDMSSMMQTMAAAIQSIAVGVSSFNDQAMQQISMVQSVFEHDIPSAIDVLRTNSIVNDVLLPFTNFPEFYSGVRSEATRLGSQLDVDLSQAEQQFESFTSVAAKEIGAAVTDVTSLFNSVYSFTQKGIEIMLSSPLLTAATMLNPMVLIVTMVLSADPVKLLTDFPAWEAELSTRQAAVNANYNSLYTFVSTGLPQAENVILGLLSQVAVLGNGVIKGRLQRVGLGWPEGAPDSSNAAANDIDRTRVLLGSNNAMRDAVRSAVYYRLQPGLVPGAVKATTDAAAAAEAIQYMPALVAGHATATDADAGSALPTWAL
ncbi:hypothetical protein LPJ61_002393 [Coemansia biformis]|uniref:Uncharacterized protein n=1 Tax=Coemansia biformis TaxID=1286918 RepID=A0A9W8CZP9_9FUNG|nr:hypothetical protein LPJ61_002393 [Coemansia biformis]